MMHCMENTTSPPRPFPLVRMARQLGIPSKILRELAESGKVPALRVGEAFLFDAEATKSAICTEAKKGGRP